MSNIAALCLHVVSPVLACRQTCGQSADVMTRTEIALELTCSYYALLVCTAVPGSTIHGPSKDVTPAPHPKLAVNGPLTTGHFSGTTTLIPAQEVLAGTPNAAITINGNALQEVLHTCSSFLPSLARFPFTSSPQRTSGTNTFGRAKNDAGGLTLNRFVVQLWSKGLYALGACKRRAAMRGRGYEALRSPVAGWQLIQLN
ncbi:hypothetical protein B0H19DRAFT_1083058 [Mycena capillaripes]|nr:hypothetical protein B0H19DRAFT_1083058 [Mycena capillaripes]